MSLDPRKEIASIPRGDRLTDSKTGPNAVQLPPPARAVLAGLPQTSRFVFPNAKGTGPTTDLGPRWLKLRKLAGFDDGRIHDYRHTFSSREFALVECLSMFGKFLVKTGNSQSQNHKSMNGR